MSQFLGGPSQSVVGHTVRNFKVPQQSVPRSLGRKEPHSEVDNNMKYILSKKNILVSGLRSPPFREFRARLVQLDHASSKRICTRESSNEIHNATSCLKCLTTTFSCPYDGFDFHTRLTHPATWLFAQVASAPPSRSMASTNEWTRVCSCHLWASFDDVKEQNGVR